MGAATVLKSPALGVCRLLLYAGWTIALIPLQAGAVALRLPLGHRLPNFYHATCCRILGLRLQVIGHRSKIRPTLFVANHCSYLDIMVFGALLRASFVAKAEVADWPFFGLLAKLQRSVFIDREPKSARKQIQKIKDRLDRRDRLIMFPEGTSGDGVRVLPFKSALMAIAETGAGGKRLKVQPVTIAYTRLDGAPIGRHLRPFFNWYGDMELAPHLWQFVCLGRPTVTVVFHDAVTLDEFGTRKALSEHCQAVVAQGYVDAVSGRWATARQRRRRRPRSA